MACSAGQAPRYRFALGVWENRGGVIGSTGGGEEGDQKYPRGEIMGADMVQWRSEEGKSRENFLQGT